MTDRETQRVALVTGGAVRLGRHIARGLAEAGWDVAISYRASAGAAGSLAAEVRALGRRCERFQADLAEPEAAERLIGSVQSAFGRLDLLVNSAATFDERPLLDVDATIWDAVMDVNVRAPHLLVRAAAPLLRDTRGSVVNLSDLAAFQAWTDHPHHAVSKAALEHLTRVQARVLAPEVRVNAVAPGAVLPPDDWQEDRLAPLARAAPLKRLGSPEDVVQAVLYLADAAYVTGHTLVVDGGRLLRF